MFMLVSLVVVDTMEYQQFVADLNDDVMRSDKRGTIISFKTGNMLYKWYSFVL